MPQCKSCGAAIWWRQHEQSRQLTPIDPDPTEKGNIELNHDGTYAVLSGQQLEEARREKRPLHLNHFATCPNANAHRKNP